MLDKMKQLMDIKRQAQDMKKELESLSVDVQQVPGIKITITGAQQFCRVEIDEKLLQAANKASIEADLLRSLNAAIRQSQDIAAEKMASFMPGLL